MPVPSATPPSLADEGELMIRRRARSWFRQPRLQLALPLRLLLLSAGFAGAWAIQTYFAFEAFVATALRSPLDSASIQTLLLAQLHDFFLATAVIGVGFALCLVVVTAAHGHRMLGPAVAIRRQVRALLDGDYASRVGIRKGDAFAELAEDLNRLAESLEAERATDAREPEAP